MTSSNRSSNHAEAEYPLLVEIADYLEKLHSTKEDISVIDTFASGTILCDIVADFIGTEFIDDYHQDAKSFSQQAEDNYLIFSVACEKIQIPRSCVATASDFKEKNYKKIELTFVLFVVRGMAYGLPDVPAELAEKLKNYKFAQYPEQKKDLQTCDRILDIYRNCNNDKNLPIEVESISDSDSGSDNEMKRTEIMDQVKIDKNEEEEDKQQESSESEIGVEEASNSEEDTISEKRTVASKHSTLSAPIRITGGGVVEDPIRESIADSDGDVDEFAMNQIPEEKHSSSRNSEESEGEAPTEASTDEVDEVPISLPQVEPEPQPQLKPESESDKVDEVPQHEPRQGPRVVVIPREPEVITQSNDPVGFDVDPHETEEEKREREERERQRREKKEEAKKRRQQQQQQQEPPVVQPEVSLVPMEKFSTAVAKPQKRLVKWYIVALFIVLMLICLACSIICGVFLAKINQ